MANGYLLDDFGPLTVSAEKNCHENLGGTSQYTALSSWAKAEYKSTR